MREAANYNAWLLALVRRYLPSSGRTLNFGAGAGTFALPLHRAGAGVICLEPDAALSTKLRAQGMAVVTSPDELGDATLDFIYSLNVLEHIEDDRGTLRTLHSKLKPTGTLLLYVPAFQILYGPMDAQVGHVRRYRRHELASKCREAGFSVELARYGDSLGFFAALAFRMLNRSGGNLNPAHVRLYDRWAFPLSLLLDHVTWPFFGKNVTVVARRAA